VGDHRDCFFFNMFYLHVCYKQKEVMVWTPGEEKRRGAYISIQPPPATQKEEEMHQQHGRTDDCFSLFAFI
jgi:hypothetical protein